VEVEERLRVAADEPLGQRGGQREERPVPVAAREGPVGAAPDLPRRDESDRLGAPTYASSQ
jgi:hypothetical protein